MELTPTPIGGGYYKILNGQTVRGKLVAETTHNQLLAQTMRDGMMRRIPKPQNCRHLMIRRITNKKLSVKDNRIVSSRTRGAKSVRFKTLDECCQCEQIIEMH